MSVCLVVSIYLHVRFSEVIMVLFLIIYINVICYLAMYCSYGGAGVSAVRRWTCDLLGRDVILVSTCHLCNNLRQVVHTRSLCASVTKQYNLVPVEGR